MAKLAPVQRAPSWRGEDAIPRWVPMAGAAAIAVAAAAFILFANRGTTFVLDDWAYLVQRTQDLTGPALFGSQNGSWTTTTVLAYRALAELFGIGSYLPWRLLSLVTHVGCCALVYVLARRRLGPWWALVPLALVLVSRGWETLLWPFQIGQLFSILTGLGALVLLDRRDLRGDLGASVLLVISLASSSYGPPFALLVAVELALSRWRALWVLAAPAAAYVWWQEAYNSAVPAQGDTSLAGYRGAVNLAWDVVPGGPAAIFGTSFAVGRFLLIAVVALAVARIALERRVPARLVALIVAYFAYWWLVAWARSEIPDLGRAPRYVDLAVVLFVLAAVELFAGVDAGRWPERTRGWLSRARTIQPAVGPALFVLVVLIAARGVVLTADVMKKGSGTTFRVWGQRMLAQEAAYGVGRRALTAQSPFYIETSGGFALGLPLGSIESTAKRYGGELYTGEGSLRARSPDARAYADQALSRAENAMVVEPPRAAARGAGREFPRVVQATAKVTSRDGCVRWSAPQFGTVRVSVPPRGLRARPAGGLIAVAPVRWGDRPLEPEAQANPGQSVVIRLKADGSRQPWLLEAAGPAGTICSLPTAADRSAARRDG